MGFNYGLEKKRFDAKWAKKAAWYRAEGMSEEAIQSIYDFDFTAFNAERSFVNHTQELPDASFENESTRSCLYQKYPSLSTSMDMHEVFGRDNWIDGIENPELAKELHTLSASDIEVLTMFVFDGLTQTKIARLIGCSQSNISQKIGLAKKILKKYLR
ncbi:MAG: sigma-70 family RNA polymerase sigma factor [Clostridiales bacterium]|nr:sigma-70 family RNA polymerase sigma factor [Clostridiales bacterium]